MILTASIFLASLALLAWEVTRAPRGRQDTDGFHAEASPLVNHRRLTLVLLVLLNLSLALAIYVVTL